MKKNLMSVIILALVLVNLILTAVMMISVMPQTKQANELISKVCAAIDLDLEGGGLTEANTIPLDKVVTYTLNEGNDMTVNLKPDADGVEHFAIMKKVSIGMNTEDEDYATFGTDEQLADKESMLMDCVNSVVGGHTASELRDDKEMVRDEIVKAIRAQYGSNFVVSVNFSFAIQ